MAECFSRETCSGGELMEKIHQCDQEILDAFVQICEEYGLRYYLAYGTLLGAIRHKGPIPWDDDIDVLMPREDLERFKQIMLARPEGEAFHIHCYENDPNYPYFFPRLNKSGTVCRVADMQERKLRFNEIWIDVFPMDSVKQRSGFSYWFRCRAVPVLLRLSANKQASSKTMTGKGKLMHVLLSAVPYTWLQKTTEHIMQNDVGGYYIHWGIKYGCEKRTMPKEWFEPAERGLYSGKYYRIPAKWNEVLSQVYGDYMQLPPEEKRKNHTILELQV